jgi:D-sedoheptulose 7-phosphate isomerase
MKITTVGFGGATGGSMVEFCDRMIMIPSKTTAQIQEGHLILGHILCGLVEQRCLRGNP